MTLDKAILSSLKAASVGIGVIIKKKPVSEVEAQGTGFFVSSTGYVMTANHVVKDCLKTVQFYMNKKVDVGLVAIRLKSLPNNGFKVTMMPMQPPFIVHMGKPSTSEQGGISHTIDLDVAVLRPIERNVRNEPFLKIKKASPINLYDEIAMCGYPSGKSSFTISQEILALRLSPTMQFGRIAGLMPNDFAEYPYAIQTDIVGTGGSSGSPIIDLKTGEVIAMAQKVLPAGVGGQALFKRKNKPLEKPMEGQISALSNIGLVYGLSHNVLDGIPEGARMELEEGIPYRDPPKISLVKHAGWEIGYKP